LRAWETSFHPDKSRERENLAIKGNVSKDQYQSGEVKALKLTRGRWAMKDSSSSLFLAFLMRFLSRQLYSQAQMPRLMERRQPRISVIFKSYVASVSSNLIK
jgi:hypothetical protein